MRLRVCRVYSCTQLPRSCEMRNSLFRRSSLRMCVPLGAGANATPSFPPAAKVEQSSPPTTSAPGSTSLTAGPVSQTVASPPASSQQSLGGAKHPAASWQLPNPLPPSFGHKSCRCCRILQCRLCLAISKGAGVYVFQSILNWSTNSHSSYTGGHVLPTVIHS